MLDLPSVALFHTFLAPSGRPAFPLEPPRLSVAQILGSTVILKVQTTNNQFGFNWRVEAAQQLVPAPTWELVTNYVMAYNPEWCELRGQTNAARFYRLRQED